MAERRIVAVGRTYAQHGSLVVVIPMLFRTELKLGPGDYVTFSLGRDSKRISISKFEVKELDNGPGS